MHFIQLENMIQYLVEQHLGVSETFCNSNLFFFFFPPNGNSLQHHFVQFQVSSKQYLFVQNYTPDVCNHEAYKLFCCQCDPSGFNNYKLKAGLFTQVFNVKLYANITMWTPSQTDTSSFTNIPANEILEFVSY